MYEGSTEVKLIFNSVFYFLIWYMNRLLYEESVLIDTKMIGASNGR